MIPRYFIVAERDHELQNPISADKLLLLGERLRLGPELAGARHRVRPRRPGGPPRGEFGCSIDGIEIAPEFHAVAVERAEAAGLGERVSFRLGDASKERASRRGTYDAALCLGASFVWGGLAGTLDALEPTVRPGGHVVVGEPFWRSLPLPEDYADRNEPFTTLEGTVRDHGVGHPRGRVGHRVLRGRLGPLRDAALARGRGVARGEPRRPRRARTSARATSGTSETYLRYGREYLGWAIFVGWKRPG